ncbi:MAG: glycine/betaine ABC transporter substrate-binding protein [Deltaproteobacteria bacterium]|nr:glycine/betaine ABC transporter substrate-binding protein [Deltaproteobacteria bacterium]
MKKKRCVLVWIVFLAFVLLAMSVTSMAEKRVTIGGKNFTEQYILPEMAKILMEKNGFKVTLRTGVGSAVVRQSLEKAQIDFYYEYTGTAYTVYHKQNNSDIMTNQAKCYEWVKENDEKKGIVWLDEVQFNNTYTLMMREQNARDLGIASISNLSRYMNKNQDKLVIGVNAEFWERPDGFKPLMKLYGFQVPYDKVKKMDSGIVYKALKEKEVDVSMGFATDGRIAAFGFINLKDDKSYFPIYNPAPVVRSEFIKKYPETRNILKPIAERLTTKEMQKLNAQADIEHKKIEEVARSWLQKNGLL